MADEISYVIGTQDSEIARLGVQHRVWRPSVLELWRLAGIAEGMRVMDCGAGPGYAAFDLAEIVGPTGSVVAIERSHRFVTALCAIASTRALGNLEIQERDLLDFDWPEQAVERIWCRWVLAFVTDPASVVEGMAHALRPGGKLILQEYYDYASWRLAPRSPVFEDYVGKIIARWRAASGEPDIGLALPRLLNDAGLNLELVRPVVYVARMDDFVARWPFGFARDYIAAMMNSGDLTTVQAQEIAEILTAYERDSNALVITPGVLQLVASKPG